jgi:predicted amidohydrolase YtcJ
MSQPQPHARADLVIRHGRIYTLDPMAPWAQALAIRDGRIVWVGDDDGALPYMSVGATVLDAEGRFVMPGFIDSHNHIRLGSDADCVQLAGATSLDEIHARISTWLRAHPLADWIEAEGFSYTAIPGGRMPTAADLDAMTGDHPALVFTYDVHNLWLNTEAMRRLGIRHGGQVLPFGVAHADPVTSVPTGFVGEFAVRGLSRDGQRALGDHLPWASDERRYRRLLHSLRLAAACGITTIVEPQNSLDDLPLFARAQREGHLRSRLIAALFYPHGTTDADLDAFADAARRYHDEWFRVGPIKLYIDDVVEPHTAALLEPYAPSSTPSRDTPDPSWRGETFYTPEEFVRLVTTLDRRGFQTFTHATGDRGIRVALDAVEQACAANGPRDARHQLVHVECPSADDIPRFAQLGVVACMQPRHCAPEIAGPGHDWAEAVGPSRWPQAWPFRSLHAAGAPLAFSSDWNVAEMEPLLGIYTAITRRSRDGSAVWLPEETVDLPTALHAYTLGGAFANFCEHDRGSLTPGKLADLVVLSDSLFDLAPQAVKDVQVDLTIVGGQIIHDRAAASS